MKLSTLYAQTSLEQGMSEIARSIASCNGDAYNRETEDWMRQSNYLIKEQEAVALKRIGDFKGAMNIYNNFFESRPHLSRLHYSAFKTLAAAGQMKEAYQAIQLWCLAIVPDLVFPNLERFFDPNSNPVMDASRNSEVCQHLYLWPINVADAMYHLGSSKMIASGMLTQQGSRAYSASLAGQYTPIEHSMEQARNLGVNTAAQLPWMAISKSIKGRTWDLIISATFYAVRYHSS
jgi:hypothetical protein